MSTAATDERQELCDLFAAVGPDAPTLCGDWTTRELAAHLVVRERRPDGAAGVLIKPLAGYTAKVQDKVASVPWDELVERVRSGPPMWSPMRLDAIDRVANTVEFFVHHEDVRRAGTEWTARDLGDELRTDLTAALGRMAKLLTRKAPSGLVLVPTDGGDAITAKKGDPSVTVTGPVGELVLFVYGRGDQAAVDMSGTDDAVAAMRSASFGV